MKRLLPDELNMNFGNDSASFRSYVTRSIADQISALTPGKVVFDACAGVGGNTIAFALDGKRVIASEIDEKRFNLLSSNVSKFNLCIPEVCLIRGDFLTISKAEGLPAVDVVYLDVPWGGTTNKIESFGISDFSINFLSFVNCAKGLAQKIGIKLPYNFRAQELNQFGWDYETYSLYEVPHESSRAKVLYAILSSPVTS